MEQKEFRYAIRIKSNAVLERKIGHLLRRPVGRPSRKQKVFYHSFRYRAGLWDCARRKEGKTALKWTKLSCRRFKDNAARLHLFALAYNLANSLRQLALPRSTRSWSLTTLREKLVKIGATVVTHVKSVVFQLAEVAGPRQLFAAILERIGRLRLAWASGEVCRAGQNAPDVVPVRPRCATRADFVG